MSTFEELWTKFAASKKYREEFVAAQVKRGIPFQIRALMKQQVLSQDELADRSGLSQGVISRAANLNYGNLTLNTIIRVAAGFDVAFVGKFVPFSELGRWFIELSEKAEIPTFAEECSQLEQERQECAQEAEKESLTEPVGHSKVTNIGEYIGQPHKAEESELPFLNPVEHPSRHPQ